jgi:4'-phosphopantetheinyl transferase
MGTPESPWCPAPEPLLLGPDEVHVLRATLDLPLSWVQTLQQTLAEEEQIRAAQFHFPKDRMRFIVARGLLRAILGRYLAREPCTLQFCYNQYGKPTFVRESGSDALSFNMTHSHGMALYAITCSRIIGIDLEYISTDVSSEQIAERFFSAYEVRMLRAIPKQIQHEAFFCCWTRKEAYLKARGMGLSLDLNEFDVSVTPGAPAELLSTREENQDIARWSLYDLFPGPGYVAALAVEGHPSHIKCLQWSDVNERVW